MKPHQNIFPPIPPDTSKAAKHIFGAGNVYIKIGEIAPQLFQDLFSEETEISGEICPEDFLRLAILHAIEFAEGITDRQMVEAVEKRLDLKYALHLQVNGCPVVLFELCRSRQHILSDPSRMSAFQKLLNRFTQIGLFASTERRKLQAKDILEQICMLNRLETAGTGLRQAFESLAVKDPQWLRTIILPNWYISYSSGSREAGCIRRVNIDHELHAGLIELAGDIHYLLEELDRSARADLLSLSAVASLRGLYCSLSQFSTAQSKPTRQGAAYHSGCDLCWAGDPELQIARTLHYRTHLKR